MTSERRGRHLEHARRLQESLTPDDIKYLVELEQKLSSLAKWVKTNLLAATGGDKTRALDNYAFDSGLMPDNVRKALATASGADETIYHLLQNLDDAIYVKSFFKNDSVKLFDHIERIKCIVGTILYNINKVGKHAQQ